MPRCPRRHSRPIRIVAIVWQDREKPHCFYQRIEDQLGALWRHARCPQKLAQNLICHRSSRVTEADQPVGRCFKLSRELSERGHVWHSTAMVVVAHALLRPPQCGGNVCLVNAKVINTLANPG